MIVCIFYTAKIKEQHSYVESQAGRRKLMYVVFIDWYLSIPKPRLHSSTLHPDDR